MSANAEPIGMQQGSALWACQPPLGEVAKVGHCPGLPEDEPDHFSQERKGSLHVKNESYERINSMPEMCFFRFLWVHFRRIAWLLKILLQLPPWTLIVTHRMSRRCHWKNFFHLIDVKLNTAYRIALFQCIILCCLIYRYVTTVRVLLFKGPTAHIVRFWLQFVFLSLF